MTNLFLAAVQYQLRLIEAYENNLDHFVMDEAQVNEALKSWLTSLLPLLSAQRNLTEQMVSAHREVIGRYRDLLQGALQPDGRGAP